MLVILDDYFPNLLTGFRIAEYNAYLEAFPDLLIMSVSNEFDRAASEYFTRFPQFRNRVKRFDQVPLLRAKLAYVTFLENASIFVPYLEHFRVPFVLQLYPGGGFGLHNPERDAKLDRVCSSPMLRRIITTQSITDHYIQARFNGRVKTDFIFGAVFDDSLFEPVVDQRTYFGAGKSVLDVCFAAFKYMPLAADKGYPEFVEAAHRIAAASDKVRFHVIGNIEPGDVDTGALGERIQFHGSLATADLRRLFLQMDLIVSPNKPSQIYQGNYDGFPTATVTEAALAGVAMVTADPLGLNHVFQDDDAIAIIDSTARSTADRILRFVGDPPSVQRMARRGRDLSVETYKPQQQLAPRMDILREELGRTAKPNIPSVASSSPAIGDTSALALEIFRVFGLLIPADVGGGCPIEKALYLANAIVKNNMKCTLEIGVYRGRSLVPQAIAHKRTGGLAIGVDPFRKSSAKELESPAEHAAEIDRWLESTDFDGIHAELAAALTELELNPYVNLIRATSDEALPRAKEYALDMLHIDGNHDSVFVRRDLANYLPLLKQGGLLIMDDIDWPSVAVCLDDVEASCVCMDRFAGWGVWRKS